MPEPTWTICGLTLPVTSWIKIVIAAGTLCAAGAALWTARIMMKNHRTQMRESGPIFGQIKHELTRKNDKAIILELVNCGRRASVKLKGRAVLLQFKGKEIISHHMNDGFVPVHNPIVPGGSFPFYIYTEDRNEIKISDIKGESSGEPMDWSLVCQIDYSDSGWYKERITQRFYYRFTGWENMVLLQGPAEIEKLDKYIAVNNIFPEFQ